MSILADKLDRALVTIREAKPKVQEKPVEMYSGWWKDPIHPYYRRAYAEDCLYMTIGPMRPDSKWSAAAWNPRASKSEGLRPDLPFPDGCAPPPDYEQGGKAPIWTETEVVIAYAGDPIARKKSKSPIGSPLMRIIKKLSRIYRKENPADVDEMYALGLSRLALLLKPGYDQGRSPFISYAQREVEQAIQNGFGSTAELNKAKVALKTLISSRDSKAILKVIDLIGEQYRSTQVSGAATPFDKTPENPYAQYSGIIFELGTQLLTAIQNGDIDYETEIREELNSTLQRLEAGTEMNLGLRTGLMQAVSQERSEEKPHDMGYRWLMNAKSLSDIGTILNPGHSKLRAKENPYGEHTEYIMQKAKEMIPSFKELENIRDNADEEDPEVKSAKSRLINQILGVKQQVFDVAPKAAKTKKVHSLDAPAGEDGPTGAEELEAQEEVKFDLNPGTVRELLNMGLRGEAVGPKNRPLYNLSDPKDAKNYEDTIAPMALELHQSIVSAGLKHLPKPGDLKIKAGIVSTPFTAQEYRAVLRILGFIASQYPGKGVVRKNVDVPRDANGWWSPGEDPELEPVPDSDDVWTSYWVRNNYPMMGSLQMNEEYNKESEDFVALEIPSVLAQRILDDKLTATGVINKDAMNKIVLSAYNKMLVILAMFKDELMDDDITESKYDKTDLQIMFEGAYKIASLIANTYDTSMRDAELFMPHDDLGTLYRVSKLRKMKK